MLKIFLIFITISLVKPESICNSTDIEVTSEICKILRLLIFFSLLYLYNFSYCSYTFIIRTDYYLIFIVKIADKDDPHRFILPGIIFPFVALCGLICNIISIFIFTRQEMRSQVNLILTGEIFTV